MLLRLFLDAVILFGEEILQSEQSAYRERNSDGQHDKCVLNKSRKDKRDEGDSRNRYSVGKLGGNVVYVIAVRARARHNGSIGDGGAMVSAYSAREAGGDADNIKLGCGREERGYYRNKNSEGSPGGAGGEGEQTGNNENNRGKEVCESRR